MKQTSEASNSQQKEVKTKALVGVAVMVAVGGFVQRDSIQDLRYFVFSNHEETRLIVDVFRARRGTSRQNPPLI